MKYIVSARNRYPILSVVLLLLTGAVSSVYADTLIRGPYLQMGTPDSMTIRWRTDADSSSTVQYGTDPASLVSSETDPEVTTEHEVTLSGLTADTKYYYSVLDSSGADLSGPDNDHFFITSPTVGTNNTTRAWIIGDSGTANANAAAVYNAFRSRAGLNYTDLWIMLGDNAYNDGTDTQYQAAVFDMYPELLKQSPLWSTLGNHDGYSADSAAQAGPYYDIFTLPTAAEAGGVASGTEAYYSFDYGQIHFVCLDSYDTSRATNGAMLTWLESDLQATEQKWIVAFWHHPPYTKGSHNSDTEARLIDMRVNALPILEGYGVDLVLSGHSHSYERSYLLDGHYGLSTTLEPMTMVLDNGDGDKDGDGAYLKSDIIKDPYNGAVYVVAGSSGKTSSGSLDHPAMFYSIRSLGSVLLEVTNSELDAIFIDHNNKILDRFSIVKGEDTLPPAIVAALAVDDTTVEVTFSERLNISSAETIDNYVIDQGVDVSNAILSADKRTVTLTTSTLAPAVGYTLTVNDVTDEAGNYIAANNQAEFTFVNLITVEFQNGALPDSSYAGAEDAYLAQVSPNTNYGASVNLYLDGDDGGWDLSSLLRFDISEVPPEAIIESVSIQIQVFNPSNSSYSVYELNKPWVEDEVTWNQYASTGTWGTAGALGVEDRESTVLASLSPPTGSYNINLNTDGVAMVQFWVDGSSANNGVILGNTTSADGVDFYSSETSVVANRPKLTVVYSLPVDSGDTQAPTVPANLDTTVIGTNTVSLAWTVSTDNVAVEGYNVYRDGNMVGNVTGASFVDSGLTPATGYDYEVSAYDAANNESAHSPTLQVTTDSLTADMHVNAIDMSVRSNKSKIRARAVVSVIDEYGAPVPGVTVSVDWSGVVNQSVSDITGTDGTITIDSANVSKRTAGEFIATVTGISAPDYNYTPASNVETSECITTDGQSCGALPAPTGLSAVYDGGEVSLNWSDVSQATDGYKVYSSSGGNYAEIGTSTTSDYIDNGVAPDNTYYYVVTAVLGTDQSGFSNEVSVDTTVSHPIVMHADSVAVSLKKKGSRYDATAIVSVVVDGSSTPVSGATVSGTWTIGVADVGSGQSTTGANGEASIKISRQVAQTGDEIRFTVTAVARGGDTFDGTQTSGFFKVQ